MLTHRLLRALARPAICVLDLRSTLSAREKVDRSSRTNGTASTYQDRLSIYRSCIVGAAITSEGRPVNSTSNSQPTSSPRFWYALAAGAFLFGCAYVGLRWSPSSYAFVLQQLQVDTDTGLVAGVPRTDRGDEFAWQTPLLQMALCGAGGGSTARPPISKTSARCTPCLFWTGRWCSNHSSGSSSSHHRRRLTRSTTSC